MAAAMNTRGIRLLNAFLPQPKRLIRFRPQIAQCTNEIRTLKLERTSLDGRRIDRRFVAAATVISCWKCAKHVDVLQHAGLICADCGTIQQVSLGVNYFALFGLNQDFQLDAADLTSKFRYLQSHFHPDKFAGKSEREQEYSSSCSSLVNAAYQTLLNPVDRGLYLLSLLNRDIVETDLTVDAEFLAEIMAQNERLTVGDALSTHELEEIRTNIRKIIDNLLAALTSAFRSNDLESTKRTLGKLKYYNNIDSKIKLLEIERGITH